MRKNSKTEATYEAAATVPASDSTPAVAATPKARKPAKSASKTARKTASTKAAPKAAAKKAAAPKKPRTAKTVGPSDADIRLRAYFIAERRVQYALQGDSALDWIEAKRQLLEEAGQARS